MKYLRCSLYLIVLSLLAACGGTGLNSAPTLEPNSTNATVYGGQATVVRAVVPGTANVVLSDTGALPGSGGALVVSPPEASVTNLLTAKVLSASVIGQGNHTRSQASIANLALAAAGIDVRAGFINSEAQASCNASNVAAVRGTSELVNLFINGSAVTVTGEPNQVISIDGLGLVSAKVVVNEQVKSVSSSSGKITVTGLRILIGNNGSIANIAISSANAQITCKTVRPSYGDFVTGSGSIKTTCGETCGAFSLNGGRKNGALFGNLTYLDTSKNLTVRSAGVTSYTVVNSTTRLIKGKAVVNSKVGFRYEVRISDNGKGVNDTFQITVFNTTNVKTYTAFGKLVCGNLQLHNTSPSCACK